MKKIWIKQYPHGFNHGFEYMDGKCPPLTTSSWQHNNFVCIADVEIIQYKNPNQLEIEFDK